MRYKKGEKKRKRGARERYDNRERKREMPNVPT